MPFLSEDYEKLVKDAEMGGWKSTSDIKAVEFGFHKPEWNGHKWVPLNVVWVKRPVMVVEARSRDEYYNFGSYTFHYDMETPSFIRDVKDRNGVHWKTMFMLSGALRTDDGEMALLTAGSMVTADDRLKHATIIEAVSPAHVWHYFANFDANRFSLAGYAAFCK